MINKLFALHIVSVCIRSFRRMKKVCKWPTQSPKKLSISLFFYFKVEGLIWAILLKLPVLLHGLRNMGSLVPRPLPPTFGKILYLFNKRRLDFAEKTLYRHGPQEQATYPYAVSIALTLCPLTFKFVPRGLYIRSYVAYQIRTFWRKTPNKTYTTKCWKGRENSSD